MPKGCFSKACAVPAGRCGGQRALPLFRNTLGQSMWSRLLTRGNQMEGMCHLIGKPQSLKLSLQSHAALSRASGPPAHRTIFSFGKDVHASRLFGQYATSALPKLHLFCVLCSISRSYKCLRQHLKEKIRLLGQSRVHWDPDVRPRNLEVIPPVA